ncbi:MAG: hypothetical protein DRP67_00580 [Candidatus Omnitrophota bacterium]|nr:MAG: hypothetical protein DRP67_00580 [Candidatus Omnitrophota bacterium]
MEKEKILEQAKRIIETEYENLKKIRENLDYNFVSAVELILNCKGKVVVTGIGKSGIIGRKISATLASIGIPSTFLHPGEALHGDLGIVTENDVVIAISNSGETEEILRIIPSIKKIGASIISITSSKNSTLAYRSDVTISTGEIVEADIFGIIPSSSTTCQLVIGDALALTLLSLKGVQKKDFAFYHPGGSLGRRLMLKVADVMQTGERIPCVSDNATLIDVVKEINSKNLGFTLVVDKEGKLKGIITDGDLRRLLAKKPDITKASIYDCMTPNPKTVEEDKLAVHALQIMESLEITCLVVVDEEKRPKGIVHLHDLLGKKEFKVEF